MSAVEDLDYELDEKTYLWSVRAFRMVSKVLSLNFKLHHDKGQIEAGDIFLFNHFARVETFIPQYLIYNETGVLCRSVAAKEFFRGDDFFTRFLIDVGVLPNNHPTLFLLLAAEMLKGRKVVIFPEGGMVKDRRVIDDHGRYNIYSRTALTRRKHHSGAAVLALLLESFKLAVLRDYERGRYDRFDAWLTALDMPNAETLVAAARKPTCIVPANITFYPLHVDDNILRRSVERFRKGLSRRASEELLIESNLLLRRTDMDIRLGDPIRLMERTPIWQRWLMRYLGHGTDDLRAFFSPTAQLGRWDHRLAQKGMRKVVSALRDKYMHRIYMAVTVNLSHLASQLIVQLSKQGRYEIESNVFHRLLYLAVKYVQAEKGVHLHRGLRNPQAYHELLEGVCDGLTQFMAAAEDTGLVEMVSANYRFLDKVHAPQDFDDVRRENPVAVYTNESAPIAAVARVIARVTQPSTDPSRVAIARMRFDDELMGWKWDKSAFSKERHRHINEQETATQSAEPYLFIPPGHRSLGIIMVHGFLASPAELRHYGEQLAAAGHPVMGVRLKGHGTSPWDLRERNWEDWLASVRRGFSIMSAFVDRIALVGFSTGGALSLLLAADAPAGLAGVAAVSVPLKFRNKTMIFIPLVHTANTILKWLSAEERAFPFRVNQSQQPHINYRHIPIRALNELRHAIDRLEARLPEVRCPVLVLQGKGDTVVSAKSAEMLYKRLGSRRKHVHIVDADRHHILAEDVGETRALINDFLASLSV